MPERHHQVPQFLLKNFCSKEQIWLFDKHTDKTFKTNVRNAFVEGDFNTVKGDGFSLEGEQIFERAETLAAPILRGILEKKEIRHLSESDRAAIAIFVMTQHLRSKQSRRSFTIFREEMQRRFPNIPQSKYDLPGLNDLEADKFASLDFLVKQLGDLTQHVLTKDFLLAELDCPGTFWISDHPVVLHNDTQSEPFVSNLGFGVRGIQVYMPISATYALAFFCPTIRKEVQDGTRKVDTIWRSFIVNYFDATHSERSQITIELARLSQSKKKLYLHNREYENQKLLFNSQNLIFLNSLQVTRAYRFLASPQNDFELARDMLRQSPSLRQPNHIQFG